MRKLLFVCEYNACRSQMAEGFARHYAPEFAVYSAGLHPATVNTLTAEAMAEIGIPIAAHRSKQLPMIREHAPFDAVIVLAEPAWAAAQQMPARAHHLWAFPDPVAAPGEREAVLRDIRAVRDVLQQRIAALCAECA